MSARHLISNIKTQTILPRCNITNLDTGSALFLTVLGILLLIIILAQAALIVHLLVNFEPERVNSQDIIRAVTHNLRQDRIREREERRRADAPPAYQDIVTQV